MCLGGVIMLQILLLELLTFLFSAFGAGETPTECQIVAKNAHRIGIHQHRDRPAIDLVTLQNTVNPIGTHPQPDLLAKEHAITIQNLNNVQLQRRFLSYRSSQSGQWHFGVVANTTFSRGTELCFSPRMALP